MYFGYAWREKINEILSNESKYARLVEWINERIDFNREVIDLFNPADRTEIPEQDKETLLSAGHRQQLCTQCEHPGYRCAHQPCHRDELHQVSERRPAHQHAPPCGRIVPQEARAPVAPQHQSHARDDAREGGGAADDGNLFPECTVGPPCREHRRPAWHLCGGQPLPLPCPHRRPQAVQFGCNLCQEQHSQGQAQHDSPVALWLSILNKTSDKLETIIKT